MARIRSIKPDFFLDEGLAELPVATRMLFIGLWCLADREGRLEDRPKYIKAQIFPYEDADVDSMLAQLGSEWITRYEVDGKKFIQINSFAKHQRVGNREPESEIPECKARLSTLKQAQEEGKGKEGKGKESGADEPLVFLNEFPEEFQSDVDFQTAWAAWVKHRKEIGKPLHKLKTGASAMVSKLASLSVTNAVACINQSLERGWQGLFAEKYTADKDTDWVDPWARERAQWASEEA